MKASQVLTGSTFTLIPLCETVYLNLRIGLTKVRKTKTYILPITPKTKTPPFGVGGVLPAVLPTARGGGAL
jgi:hypothetical protein